LVSSLIFSLIFSPSLLFTVAPLSLGIFLSGPSPLFCPSPFLSGPSPLFCPSIRLLPFALVCRALLGVCFVHQQL